MDSSLEKMRERLNAVSPSFCLAKWYHVTIHLQTGQTHSCHHPATHLVPIKELADNPSALHNTRFKKQRRKEMLTGVRPAECDYCWNVEDAFPSNLSDRMIKSNDPSTEPFFDAAKTMPWDADIVPTQVEVSFSNVCNFKCSYCHPKDSSKWYDEISQYGPYPTTTTRINLRPVPRLVREAYIDAFWKWWPELYPALKIFRVTGGEPLLSKDTFRVLEWIIDHPQPNLQLAINSNLFVPNEVYGRFLDLTSTIVQRGCVKNFTLLTSVDAHGERANYIRNGLDYSMWLANVRRYFETVPDQRLVIMSAFNALSITSFSRLYDDVIELRKAYPDKSPGADPAGRIEIDMPYLRYPEYQSIMVLPSEYADLVDDILAKVKDTPEATNLEVLKLTRIRSLMQTPWPEKKLRSARADFYRFFAEHDRRRGTNFLETFPEMADFWETCRDLAEPNFWQSPARNLWLKAFGPARV
jgi:hypothetical protein